MKHKKVKDKGYFALPGNKGTVIYEIGGILDPFIKPLSAVNVEVGTMVRNEKEQKLSNDKLIQYSNITKSPQAFNKLASTLKVQPKNVSFNFTDSYIESLPVGNEFRTEVFKMRENQIKAIYDSGRGFLVHLANKKAKKVTELDKKTADNLQAQLRSYKANIILNAFINQMKTKVEVEYNDSL